jgi:hypothetical protein
VPFESPDWPLSDLLSAVAGGKLQLPDFQRDWKWDDDRIASLLATVSLGYPIGVVMTLETGGDGSRFKPKPISGVPENGLFDPEQLLLDGQQRLTSLYQALQSGNPVETVDSRGKRLRRWYYIDIDKALGSDGDREDAVVSITEDRRTYDDFGRQVREDFSTKENECAAGMFPLRIALDGAATIDWLLTYIGADPSRQARFQEFQTRVLSNFTSYLVPVIKLTKSTPKEAVCTVFEKVNTGGVPLNVFELLTATFAGDKKYFAEHGTDFRLNDYWREVQARLSTRQVLRGLENTDYLQAIALLATYSRRLAHTSDSSTAPGVSCKRRDILRLSLVEFLRWAPRVTEGFEWAATFLGQEHIFNARDVPYRTQLVPLAATRAAVGDDIELHGVDTKLRRWYWSGVLGELYGGSTETRLARDLEQVVPWLKSDGSLPGTVADANFHERRLLTLRTRNSAAYKGLYALLMRNGGMDWAKNQPLNMATFFDFKVDIHHIFPKKWCETNDVDDLRRESIVNKTALSRQTNIRIGGKSPTEYLRAIESFAGIGADKLDDILRTHAIDPAEHPDAFELEPAEPEEDVLVLAPTG